MPHEKLAIAQMVERWTVEVLSAWISIGRVFESPSRDAFVAFLNDFPFFATYEHTIMISSYTRGTE